MTKVLCSCILFSSQTVQSYTIFIGFQQIIQDFQSSTLQVSDGPFDDRLITVVFTFYCKF